MSYVQQHYPYTIDTLQRSCYLNYRGWNMRKDGRDEYFRSYRASHQKDRDTIPEDKGCAYHSPSCLDCPFTNCIREERTPSEAHWIYNHNTAPVEPKPAAKPSPVWNRPAWWGERYNIPVVCPHCGSKWVGQDGYPDEVFCYKCGSTILSWVPTPNGWHSPYYTPSKYNRIY